MTPFLFFDDWVAIYFPIDDSDVFDRLRGLGDIAEKYKVISILFREIANGNVSYFTLIKMNYLLISMSNFNILQLV